MDEKKEREDDKIRENETEGNERRIRENDDDGRRGGKRRVLGGRKVNKKYVIRGEMMRRKEKMKWREERIKWRKERTKWKKER